MEQPVIGVHLVIIRRVFLPDLMRFHCMKTCRMIQIKLLHMSDFKNALVEVLNPLIPEHRPALLHSLCDDIYVNRMVDDVRHQLFQNAFVDAREDFCADKLFNRKLTEPCRETQFIFGFSCDVIKLLRLI